MFVSRDKDGTLILWSEKPYRDSSGIHGEELDMWNYKCEIPCESMELDWKLFPNLKWEDEPIEIDIIKHDELIQLKRDSIDKSYLEPVSINHFDDGLKQDKENEKFITTSSSNHKQQLELLERHIIKMIDSYFESLGDSNNYDISDYIGYDYIEVKLKKK